jgi:hypothetical protein
MPSMSVGSADARTDVTASMKAAAALPPAVAARIGRPQRHQLPAHVQLADHLLPPA